MQIIFLGNWNVGYLALRKALEGGISVSLVVTDYDESDCDEYRNKVYDLACMYSIPVYKSYKDILNIVDEKAIGFSVAYGNEIFKRDILDKVKIYNFHPSYLPCYKGASPIQWQIKCKESTWGMSCHVVDDGIDTGEIVSRDKYIIDEKTTYMANLDEYNMCFSEFIYENINDIIKKTCKNIYIETIKNSDREEDYKPRLVIPKSMWNNTLNEISQYLNQKRVLFFAGNRAELGILFPIILEMSRYYYVDVIVSDSYFTNGVQDLEEKEDYIYKNGYRVNILKIITNCVKDIYFEALPNIYKKVFRYLQRQKEYQYRYAIVLGDRIESFGFALAAFYGQVPLVHIAGGDVANVPYYDTNVRHSISKLANLHLAFSEESKKTLMQLGEEEKRICNIGTPVFDYGRMGLLLSKEEVEAEFHIADGKCIVFTYHAGPLKNDAENLAEYIECFNGVLNSVADKIIVTYPNHDPGSAEIIRFLDEMMETERIAITRSLGTTKLHTLMNNFKIIIAGNSSSGLTETSYYGCPALNIGDRQNDRIRGINVIDSCVNQEEITSALNQMIEQYDRKKNEYVKHKSLFGDGKAALKALEFLDSYVNIPNKELIIKKFVRENVGKRNEDYDYITAPR